MEYRFCRHAIAPSGIEWLTVNGSCRTAAETRSFARALGLKPVTTPVSSPQSNGMANVYQASFEVRSNRLYRFLSFRNTVTRSSAAGTVAMPAKINASGTVER